MGGEVTDCNIAVPRNDNSVMKVKDLLILPYAILKQLQKFCKPTDFR